MAITKSVTWKDDVHEDEGGSDAIGPRPQESRSIMKEETQKIIREVGGGEAWDDGTGASLDPGKVREAR